jgi:ankyrin repeat protein
MVLTSKAKDIYGCMPLHWARYFGHENIISLLLEKDADINDKDNGGKMPLHHAIIYGNKTVISLLWENGANMNAKDKDGKMPLHYACHSREVAVIPLLLENGTDPTITNNNGKTLQIAQEMNKQECVITIEQFLQNKIAKLEEQAQGMLAVLQQSDECKQQKQPKVEEFLKQMMEQRSKQPATRT